VERSISALSLCSETTVKTIVRMAIPAQECPPSATRMFANTATVVICETLCAPWDALRTVAVEYDPTTITPQGLVALEDLKAKAYEVEESASTH